MTETEYVVTFRTDQPREVLEMRLEVMCRTMADHFKKLEVTGIGELSTDPKVEVMSENASLPIAIGSWTDEDDEFFSTLFPHRRR